MSKLKKSHDRMSKLKKSHDRMSKLKKSHDRMFEAFSVTLRHLDVLRVRGNWVDGESTVKVSNRAHVVLKAAAILFS